MKWNLSTTTPLWWACNECFLVIDQFSVCLCLGLWRSTPGDTGEGERLGKRIRKKKKMFMESEDDDEENIEEEEVMCLHASLHGPHNVFGSTVANKLFFAL